MQKYANSSNVDEVWKNYCKDCFYGCNKKFLMSQHQKTKKHLMLKNARLALATKNTADNNTDLQECRCGRKYKHVQSYNRHLKNCDKANVIVHSNVQILMTTLAEQCKNIAVENAEMRRIVAELLPRVGNNTTINNQINIQMFLNEECKDALNLTDFIETLHLDHADLNSTRENGYAIGITNIFLRGLKALAFNKRPIHCSDLKQEILYVKDDGVWEKEDNDKRRIKGAITSVAKKQINTIKQWEENHPGWQESERGTQEYCEMIQQVTSPSNSEDENKIIKSIAREIIIDK